ncbi:MULTISPECIES: DUF3046 domain-containing protein [unclassified Microbacterium]|uniref:DUF3046 domain-containing protein n=1 Tax=unclassified Microbacterium TaxID=2609290 RepID=UPI000EAA844A|nr:MULTISPECIES: DUF3046 domain-containing protein [unclassified Microbacterium]MBT2485610.1 DUF3046 domain-containing protein [Microbacterium sp. ISL-108]RKN68390.1 DUF3046 domain-containing protein [Microbacterium sp. CGR2]
MRRSEFLRAVDTEFQARATSLINDLVLGGLGGRTAAEALTDGTPPREIWLALCVEMDVPDNRRHGVGRQEPKRRSGVA